MGKWTDIASAIIKTMDKAGEMLTDEQAATIPELYSPWDVNAEFTMGERRLYNGALYKCLQPHAAQETWNPEEAPSLWAKVLTSDTGEILPWVQPDSTNGYKLGDKVTHNGKTWECTGTDSGGNNTWEPGVYGWTEV